MAELMVVPVSTSVLTSADTWETIISSCVGTVHPEGCNLPYRRSGSDYAEPVYTSRGNAAWISGAVFLPSSAGR